jgi:hypothetical protein
VSRETLATRINNNLTSSRLYSTRSQDLPLCDSIRNMANNNASLERVHVAVPATPPAADRLLKKSGSVVRLSSSNTNVDNMLMLNNTCYPTQHTIIVPAPIDVRNGGRHYTAADSSDDTKDDELNADMTEEEKIRRQNSFPSLLLGPRSLRTRKPAFTIEGAMNAIKRKKSKKKMKRIEKAEADVEAEAGRGDEDENVNGVDDDDDGPYSPPIDQSAVAAVAGQGEDASPAAAATVAADEVTKRRRFNQLFRSKKNTLCAAASDSVKLPDSEKDRAAAALPTMSPEEEPMLLSTKMPPWRGSDFVPSAAESEADCADNGDDKFAKRKPRRLFQRDQEQQQQQQQQQEQQFQQQQVRFETDR